MLPLTNMFQIQCLNSKTESKTNILAKFCIEPLKKGQGITIGNTLRRVLLSDLPGIAIVGVRISGVSHEFSTIPGLKEDIVELLLKHCRENGTTLVMATHDLGCVHQFDVTSDAKEFLRWEDSDG